jgi:UDP-GlcNAc3NAcA epimerase
VLFPIHPRTVSRAKSFGLNLSDFQNIEFLPPVGYIESISYQKYSDCIITDSGGMQKEAYLLKKKCITLRSETEWRETLEHGWNTLVFDDLDAIGKTIDEVVPGKHVDHVYGMGNAAKEIVEHIKKELK